MWAHVAQSFAPVPDTLLAAAAAEKQHGSTVGGLDTVAGYATTDLTAVGEGRNTVRGPTDDLIRW